MALSTVNDVVSRSVDLTGKMAQTATFFIIFEVEERYATVFSASVKSLGDWAILTPTTIMVRTKKSSESVMEQLQPLIGPGDSLWLITPSAPWSGYGDPIACDHVEAALGPESGNWVPKH